jgi:hypothetical protein
MLNVRMRSLAKHKEAYMANFSLDMRDIHWNKFHAQAQLVLLAAESYQGIQSKVADKKVLGPTQ